MNPILLIAALSLAGGDAPVWTFRATGTAARFRGVAAVSREVAWASGTQGTVAVTTDGGKVWTVARAPGASALDFRDVHAVDARTAFVMSSGPGDLSRVYRTGDGGRTWSLRLTNPDPTGFFDAIAFRDADHGLLVGDPVDGRFQTFLTTDGGATWSRNEPGGMPPALPNEGAFAASGTCLVVQGRRRAWFATGGARVARVFRSTDGGRTWAAAETPVRAGRPSAGIFSLAFRDGAHGVAIGGDYQAPDQPGSDLGRTADGGATWTPVGRGPRGYRSAVTYVPGVGTPALVAAGPTGTDVSRDDGLTWAPLGVDGFHALGFADTPDSGWAVGDGGRVARLTGPLRGGR